MRILPKPSLALLLCTCSSLAVAGASLVAPGARAATTFLPLGDVPGGGSIYSSIATGLSADGSVAVGYGAADFASHRAFRWTEGGGLVELGDLSGGGWNSDATAASGDGSTIVGYGTVTPPAGVTTAREAFRWTAGGGLQGLGVLSGYVSSRALAISDDGTTIVGDNADASSREAFVWTQSGGMTGLGHLPGSGTEGLALDVSADGSVIVGRDSDQAFRWAAGTGMVGLGVLPGDTLSRAEAVSADGSVVVGRSGNGSDWEVFRWTDAAGMESLGAGSVWDISGDGEMLVGGIGGATIWDAANGWRDLQTVLEMLGVDLTGWDLERATSISEVGAISGDGSTQTTIAGWGTNPSGDPEAWVVTTNWLVPEPGTGWLLAVGLGVALRAERRRA